MFGLDHTQFIIMAIGTFLTLIWLIFFLVGIRKNSMFDVLAENEFPMKEVYGIGYVVLELIHYKYRGKGDRKIRQSLEILYGNKYADYYLRVVRAQQITISSIVLIMAFIFYGLSSEVVLLGLFAMFAYVAFYYYGNLPKERLQKRSEELLNDFSDVVSKLALLTNAGMILREAWKEVAFGGNTTIYLEMQEAVNEMNNGIAEIDALYNFGTRCIIPEIKKFSSTIIQGVTKGNKELADMLQLQSAEVWQLKKQLIRRAGEKAASKLLIPICIMFVGILIMILVPIFTNLGV